MNKLSPAIVLIKNIRSTQPRSAFSQVDLENAAQLILAIQGVINPLILVRTDATHYEVVNGHFEYYAALRAKEIEAIKGETINAYIIESAEAQATFEQQIMVFRSQRSTAAPSVKSDHLDNVASRLQRLEEQLVAMVGEMSALRKEMGGLAMPTVLETPVVEKVSAPPAVAKPVSSKKVVDAATSPEERFLEILNTLPIGELALKLSKIKGVKKDLANKIEAARRQKPFESLDDIESRKIGMAEKTRKKIMEKLLS